MHFHIDISQLEDGRWIAQIRTIPGAKVYGATCDEAVRKVQALALHVLADRLEQGERIREIEALFSMTA